MARLQTNETTEERRARIDATYARQRASEDAKVLERLGMRGSLAEVEAAIAAMDRALDDAKNALARCKALGVIQ